MIAFIAALVCFTLAAAAFLLSIRSFRGKGFLLNNAYLYASKQERETMDKTPYYRQSAIVFLLIGTIFSLNGLSLLLSIPWISYLATATCILTVIYAVVSSIYIEKCKKESK